MRLIVQDNLWFTGAPSYRIRGDAELITGRGCRRFLLGEPKRVTIRNRDGRRLRWGPEDDG